MAAEPRTGRRRRPPDGTGRWEWVAGRPMGDPRATGEREQLIGRVMAVVVDDARTQLRTNESRDLPAWSIRLLQERAARGECRIDPAGTADLHARVLRFRTAMGLGDDAEAASEALAEAVLVLSPTTPRHAPATGRSRPRPLPRAAQRPGSLHDGLRPVSPLNLPSKGVRRCQQTTDGTCLAGSTT